jgi:hypothetical protein
MSHSCFLPIIQSDGLENAATPRVAERARYEARRRAAAWQDDDVAHEGAAERRGIAEGSFLGLAAEIRAEKVFEVGGDGDSCCVSSCCGP